ncbi:type-4 uracil-DNA glycosylase [Desulfurococcus amylolyticus]|uniref:type-4 uracil-DNA glycosylase n=1 Tax=Desulfurococcus TaxID=2273 RepID=UPI0005B22A67|nr:type-4 uracil-DNA glycosylase [Desulfurococcus amylolyticus]
MSEWDSLVNSILNCKRCRLSQYRRNPVPGEGNVNAGVMFIGEAPGEKEDETGRPFVGAAGKLLTELIESTGFKRGDVYITNIVKCRPPGNRDPEDDEIESCLPYLLKQIELIKPRLIVALGRHAARTLFRLGGLKWVNMSMMHGRPYNAVINGLQVVIIPTFHPAAALYNPGLKDELRRDFEEVIKKHMSQAIKASTGVKARGKTILDFLNDSSRR